MHHLNFTHTFTSPIGFATLLTDSLHPLFKLQLLFSLLFSPTFCPFSTLTSLATVFIPCVATVPPYCTI